MAHEDQIKSVLEIVARSCNIKNWRYERKTCREDVLNFMSIIEPVVLIDQDNNTVTDLVIKFAPEIPQMEDVIEEMFSREVCFYNKLLPAFKNFDVSFNDMVPKCFFAVSNKTVRVIVMKDMKMEGYERYTTGLFLDQEHITVTLKAIGKFHAFSMILDDKQIKLPGVEPLKPFMDLEPLFYFKAQKFTLRKYISLFKGTQCENDLNSLYRCIMNSSNLVRNSVEKARRLVYGHGDLWKENLLFKYSKMKPIDVCLVDYQITRRICPAAEVLLFIMNCTDSAMRKRHYPSFISNYFLSLRQMIKNNGLDPEALYKEEDLNHDLRLVFPSCFSLVFMSFLMWLQFENVVTLLEEHSILPDEKNENWIRFKNIIGDLIADFKDLGIIVPT